MKNSKLLFTSFSLLLCLSAEAKADYLKLYAPRVEKGEFSAEADLNYSTDHRPEKDDYFSHVYAMEYGVNDWWMTELGIEVEKENGAGNELTNIKWENVLVPFKPGENWMDVGLYLEVEKAAHDSDPNNLEAKILLQKDFGKFSNIANIGVSREWGPNHSSDTYGSIALRSAYRLDKKFEPGIEYYAELGAVNDMPGYDEQEHLIGPVIYGKIGKVKYDTGVLFGISDEAPDTTVKLNLEYEF